MSKHQASTPALGKVKALIVFVALLSVGGVATVASFNDSATSTITANAGTIDLYTNTGGADSKSTVIDTGVTKWAPGSTSTRSLTLKNTGSLPIKVTLATTHTANGLADRLHTTIKVNGSEVYSGMLSASSFGGANVAIPAGGSVPVEVTITWISDRFDDLWASKTDSTVFTFNAVNA